MPLWKIYSSEGLFSDDDKKQIAETVTDIYAMVPIPRFYVVTIFQELALNDMYVGGVQNPQFVRFTIDHIARSLATPAQRQFFLHLVGQLMAPWVKDRGYDWEVTVDETPFDLWTLQGRIPPPFESIAEKRWVADNAASDYGWDEIVPASGNLTAAGLEG